MTLRLRCLRCGDLCELDPRDLDEWGLCLRCYDRRPGLRIGKRGRWDASRTARWNARWRRGMESHPTYKALVAALDAVPVTPA